MARNRSKVHPRQKTEYRVRNWQVYGRALRSRGIGRCGSARPRCAAGRDWGPAAAAVGGSIRTPPSRRHGCCGCCSVCRDVRPKVYFLRPHDAVTANGASRGRGASALGGRPGVRHRRCHRTGHRGAGKWATERWNAPTPRRRHAAGRASRAASWFSTSRRSDSPQPSQGHAVLVRASHLVIPTRARATD